MVPLLAVWALSWAPMEPRPVWDVLPFTDLKAATYGAFATRTFVKTLGRTHDLRILSGTEARGPSGKACVEGEIVNYRLAQEGLKRKAYVVLRVVVQDESRRYPIAGGLAKSEYASSDELDGVLIEKSIQRAMERVVRDVRSRRATTVRVLSVEKGVVTVDGGRRHGFRFGERLRLLREGRVVWTAPIEEIRDERATFRSIISESSPIPGDRLEKGYDAPKRPPCWAAMEFRDLATQNPGLGRFAAGALTEAAILTNEYRVVGQDEVVQAAERLGLPTLPQGLVHALRVGFEAFGGAEPSSLVVVGEILENRIEVKDGTRKAKVVLRAIAYDGTSLVANGARERGESTARNDVSDERLVEEAIRQAARRCSETMRRRKIPTATVVWTFLRGAVIDRGSAEGFNQGDRVVILRGSAQITGGEVAVANRERAELRIERSTIGIAPGDTVRKIFSPP